jgi:hypothetical protein
MEVTEALEIGASKLPDYVWGRAKYFLDFSAAMNTDVLNQWEG